MSRILALGLAVAMMGPVAVAQTAGGSVAEYTGAYGDLIVARDGVTYSLSVGEDLYFGDTIRMTNTGSGDATVTFNGCTHTIPAGQDIVLNGDFCTVMQAMETPTEAQLAANEIATPTPTGGEGAGAAAGGGNAPLIIGGIVVAAGGIAAAAGGGGGDDGTPTPTSP
ncbi:MAG: hypothetical protein NXH72_14010 [Hyphomonadaceae bacterium]|nr:hypothetical protein [Hyphomonadaceae bacterium]